MPYEEQLVRKRDDLTARLKSRGVAHPDIEMIEISRAGQTRDRVDLTWQKRNGELALGLYDLDKSGVVDMMACPQMSQALEEWFLEFRSMLPPVIEKGSVRLRVSPSGEKGVWLDLANADVKALLDEKQWLTTLSSRAHVEIGQRFKPLIKTESGALKLGSFLEPQAWFETYVGEALDAIPLCSAVGSFTQPSFIANKALVKHLAELARPYSGTRVLELFSGLGNFTLPLAALGTQVTSFEVDAVSIGSLYVTLKEQPSLASRIKFIRENLYCADALPKLEDFELLVVDPPRSGLKEVGEHIENTSASQRPCAIIYISCFAQSMAEDLERLKNCGYSIDTLRGIDQFPHSPHCEWICRLTLSDDSSKGRST